MVNIVKSPEFRDSLVSCLDSLEGSKDHSVVLSMLSSYFNIRNKNFGSNWVYLPTKKVTLHLNTKGIYLVPEVTFSSEDLELIDSLNAKLYAGVGYNNWVVTFKKTRPPKKEDLECLMTLNKPT